MPRIINAKDSLFFLIDVQSVFQPLIYNMPALVSSANLLLKSMDKLDVPVLNSRHYPKAFGDTIEPLRSVLDTEIKVKPQQIEKRLFSICTTDLDNYLKSHPDRKTVILAGIETHVCVMQSCLNLLDKGYKTVVVEDAVSSQRKYDREIALNRMEKEGAILTSAESLVYELMVTSENPVFKNVLGFVKERNNTKEFFD